MNPEDPKAINWNIQSSRQYYNVDRPLTSSGYEQCYEDFAPRFGRLTLSETIQEKIDTQGMITIFDAGCGQGNFLLDCRRSWGEKVTLVGMTAYPYHTLDTEQERKITTNNIKIEIGNIEDMTVTSQYDIITSIHLFEYVYDPIATLMRVYHSLKMGGVAFIHPLHLRFLDAAHEQFLQNWLRNNYSFYFAAKRSVSFQKTLPELDLPVEFAQNMTLGSGTFAYYRKRD